MNVIETINKIICSERSDYEKYLLKETAYSRSPIMSFADSIMFMLRNEGKSLAIELNNYFKFAIPGTPPISKQAFSKQRQHISYEYFVDKSKAYVNALYDTTKYQTFKGYIVIAVDGSTTEIPNTEELKAAFGAAKASNTSASNARASVLGFHDVLNNYMVLSKIDKYQKGEKTILFEMLDEFIDMMKDKKYVLVFDRGFISMEMLLLLKEKNIKYIFRVPKDCYFKEKALATSKDCSIELGITKVRLSKATKVDASIYLSGDTKNPNQTEVRYVQETLENDIVLELISNLSEDEMSSSDMAELYSTRWGIERSFDVLKNKLHMENFSSYSENGVKQDFYASIFLYNLLEAIKTHADEFVKENQKSKTNKYEYKTNINILVGFLKDEFINLVLYEYTDTDFNKFIQKIIKHLIPIEKGRVNPRVKKVTRNKYKTNNRPNF